MEMTGAFVLDKPILLTAVIAAGFSRRFGLNIYDSGKRLFIFFVFFVVLLKFDHWVTLFPTKTYKKKHKKKNHRKKNSKGDGRPTLFWNQDII